MDLLTFTAEMTKALAWPVAAVVLTYLLRGPISRAIGRIRSLKHGETELTLGDEVEDIRQAAVSEGVTISYPIPTISGPTLTLAETSPRSAILETWISIEDELRALAKRASIRPNRDPIVMISQLEAEGKINSGLADLIKELRNLRNRTTQLKERDVTRDEAEKVIMLAKSIADRLKRA